MRVQWPKGSSNPFWSTPRATPTKHFNWSRTKTSRSTSRRRHLLRGRIILSVPSWRRRSGRFSRHRRPRPGPIPAARPTSSPSTLRRRLVSMIRRKYDFFPKWSYLTTAHAPFQANREPSCIMNVCNKLCDSFANLLRIKEYWIAPKTNVP